MSSTTIDHENVIYIAIELSRSTWLVAARLPGVEKPQLHKIDTGDTTALLSHLSLLRARVAGRSGRSGWAGFATSPAATWPNGFVIASVR